MNKPLFFVSILATGSLLLHGCAIPLQHVDKKSVTEVTNQPHPTNDTRDTISTNKDSGSVTADSSAPNPAHALPAPDPNDPNGIDVLVNKTHPLPDHFQPKDLVVPNIPFLYKEQDGNHRMRKVAADALEALVAGAKKDGITIVGVSAYRSYDLQKSLYDYYVQTQGQQTADQYSAKPGTSEHETGLAIDVAGSNGQCAVEDCFANTPEAKWLAEHAAEYGFIIRYPKGKEAITGYHYEPWHIRYVGKEVASVIAKKGWTLEEFYANQEVASKS
jgi:zinc D-Ala-D-Ala carboxypeptidase